MESKSAVLNAALARLIWFSDEGTHSVIPINSGDETDASVQLGDSTKVVQERRSLGSCVPLKASMSAFHGRPDDTESTTSIGT